jgi:hypothetical protein
VRSALDESTLDYEVTSIGVAAFDKASLLKEAPQIGHNCWTATQHQTIVFDLKRSTSQILAEFAPDSRSVMHSQLWNRSRKPDYSAFRSTPTVLNRGLHCRDVSKIGGAVTVSRGLVSSLQGAEPPPLGVKPDYTVRFAGCARACV